MGKAIRSRAKAESNIEEKESDQINPLQNVAGIAFDMELQIQDAIGVVRTAQERQWDNEEGDCSDALGLVLFRLEQIREGHALIAKNAPYRNYVPSEKGELS